MPFVVLMADAEGRLSLAVPEALACAGLPRDLVPGELLETDHRVPLRIKQRLIQALGGEAVFESVQQPDGVLDLHFQPMFDASQAVIGVALVAMNAALRMGRDETLRLAEERFELLVRHGSDLLAVVEQSGDIRYLSPSVSNLLGYAPGDLERMPSYTLIHPEDIALVRRTLGESIATQERLKMMEIRLRHADGSWRQMEATLSLLHDEPAVRGVVINARDITERKNLEEQLTRQVFTDQLTRLPNRALFLHRLRDGLATAGSRRGPLTVLLLDIDGFRVVNNSLGLEAGDELLRIIGQRLANRLSAGDTFARISGDEFAILLSDVTHLSQALRTAERLLDTLRPPVRLDGQDLFISASIGITTSGNRQTEQRPEDLLREAETALHNAKRAGRGRIAVFEPDMRQQALERLELETDLRRALDRNEFRLMYHPEVDLASETIIGVEALLRWEHPRRGLIAPERFIPVAEETGLIQPIGAWVLNEACRQLEAWRANAGSAGLQLGVNLSPLQVQQSDLPEILYNVLADTGIPPNFLQLELTEGVLLQANRSTDDMLRALRGMGVRLAIDDFGIGYSTLEYLQRMPVDTLKIDRSFVEHLPHDAGSVEIVRAVTSLGQAMGLAVSAEGIETSEQVTTLQALGCRQGAGFHFAPALAPRDLEALFAYGLTKPSNAEA